MSRRPHLWVLSVGVSQYRDPQLRLQYAAADARAVADVLTRQEHGPLYDTVHTDVLVDASATREAILQALETFIGAAAPVDVAVIFLAGHGIRTEQPTAYYFLTAAASPTTPHIAGLEMAELNRQLQRLHRNIPHMVVVLDTCHAGAVAQTSERILFSTDLAPALAPAEGLYILTAARAGEQSFELAEQQHGAFTYALLDGLSGGAASADGLITLFGLASHASRVVQQLTGDQQRPYIAMIGEDLTLAAHPGRLAQVTPPPAPAHLARGEPAPQRERVAIRDFEHLRADASYDWMRKALGQDVLTAFSELHELDVYDENMLRFVTRDAPDVVDAAQRAGIDMLVEGSYWVQENQLSVTARVKTVRPLEIIASAQVQGKVDEFSMLTGQLVTTLLEQLPVQVPGPLAARLQHPGVTSLAARRLLTEADTANAAGGPAVPGVPRSAISPGASLWNHRILSQRFAERTSPQPSPWKGEGAEAANSEVKFQVKVPSPCEGEGQGEVSRCVRSTSFGVSGQLGTFVTRYTSLQPGLGWLADLGIARPSFAAQTPDFETELQATLEGYRKALESTDLDALRAYYEDFTERQETALARYFENAVGLRVEFSDVRVAVIDDVAAVSFTRRDRFTDRGNGQPQEVTVRITKRFVRRADRWVIQREP